MNGFDEGYLDVIKTSHVGILYTLPAGLHLCIIAFVLFHTVHFPGIQTNVPLDIHHNVDKLSDTVLGEVCQTGAGGKNQVATRCLIIVIPPARN